MIGNEVQLSELYTAFFNRAPDSDGFAYWLGELNNGNMTLENMSTNWAREQREFSDTYGTEINFNTFIDQIYTNVLGRVPDSAGKSYWMNELESGNISIGNFVLAVINGAKANTSELGIADALYVSNRAEIGMSFAEKNINNLNIAKDIISLCYSADGVNAADSIINFLPNGNNTTASFSSYTISDIVSSTSTLLHQNSPEVTSYVLNYLNAIQERLSFYNGNLAQINESLNAIHNVLTEATTNSDIICDTPSIVDQTLNSPNDFDAEIYYGQFTTRTLSVSQDDHELMTILQGKGDDAMLHQIFIDCGYLTNAGEIINANEAIAYAALNNSTIFGLAQSSVSSLEMLQIKNFDFSIDKTHGDQIQVVDKFGAEIHPLKLTQLPDILTYSQFASYDNNLSNVFSEIEANEAAIVYFKEGLNPLVEGYEDTSGYFVYINNDRETVDDSSDILIKLTDVINKEEITAWNSINGAILDTSFLFS